MATFHHLLDSRCLLSQIYFTKMFTVLHWKHFFDVRAGVRIREKAVIHSFGFVEILILTGLGLVLALLLVGRAGTPSIFLPLKASFFLSRNLLCVKVYQLIYSVEKRLCAVSERHHNKFFSASGMLMEQKERRLFHVPFTKAHPVSNRQVYSLGALNVFNGLTNVL